MKNNISGLVCDCCNASDWETSLETNGFSQPLCVSITLLDECFVSRCNANCFVVVPNLKVNLQIRQVIVLSPSVSCLKWFQTRLLCLCVGGAIFVATGRQRRIYQTHYGKLSFSLLVMLIFFRFLHKGKLWCYFCTKKRSSTYWPGFIFMLTITQFKNHITILLP